VRWQLFPNTIEEKNNVKARIIAAHAMIIIWMDLHPHLRIFIQPPPFPIGNRCLTIEIEWRRNMSENEYGREIGKRIKKWGIAGDISRHIEGTAEYPIMYRALGTNPQKKHPFNLYGDIKNQGEALRGTFKANSDVIPEIARILVDKDFSGMVGHGLGTSQFVAQAAAGAFWDYARWDARDLDSLEYTMYMHPIDFRRTVFFSYSGSGSTVDSNRAALKAREEGAFQVAFTSISGSPITEKCDLSIVCAGGFDTGGSDTFHYTTRLAASIWLAIEIGALTRPDARNWDELRGKLFATADKYDRMFEWVSERAEILSRRYRDVRAILAVGSGSNEGTAEEIALKYDEMGHIPTKGMCAGRHIHGALGLTQADLLTILVAPLEEPGYEALRDVAQVTYMLKSPSIAIISEEDERVAEQVDDVFRLDETDPNIFAILAILPGQLLAYFSAAAQGDINPDCQRADIARHAKVWNWLFPKDTH
jgi:glucosamine 6-phosphate synthetase-like amidotransferase/phosphosugar isomerase protein